MQARLRMCGWSTGSGLAQEERAQRAGLDYKYLQKREGKAPSSPTLSTLEKLAKGLDISLTELISLLDEWRS